MTPVQVASPRALRENVRLMALGLSPSLIAQLMLLASDLHRGGHSDQYVTTAMRSLIEEIRKERR